MTKQAPPLRIVEDHADPALEGEFIAANDVLTDEQLAAGGMVSVQAFMRTSQSKAALRQKKRRKEKAENGLKQTGVTVPDVDEARAAMRAAAAALCEGRMTPLEIVQSVSNDIAPEEPFAFSNEMAKVRAILVRGGARAWWIRRVLSWK